MIGCVDMELTSGGGLIITSQLGPDRALLIKTDRLFQVEWAEDFHINPVPPAPAMVVTSYSVRETADKGYVICGSYTSYVSPNKGIIFIKVNTSGQMIFDKGYSFWGEDAAASDVIQTNDGGYVMTGGCTKIPEVVPSGWIGKTDKGGILLWTKLFTSPGDYAAGNYVFQTIDSGYVIGGSYYHLEQQSEYKSDIMMIKTNPRGDFLWSRVYGNTANEFNSGVFPLKSGGYMMSGSSDSLIGTNQTWYRFLLARVDETGDALCYQRNISLTALDTVFPTKNLLVISEGSYVLTTMDTVEVAEDNIGETTICEMLPGYPASAGKDDDIRISPNPATEYFRVEFTRLVGQKEITIFDMGGKKLYAREFSGTQSILIDSKSFVPGIFFIRIRTDDRIIIKKLLISGS